MHALSPHTLCAQAIPDCDLDLLWSDAANGRPENLILTHVLVPPVAVRPSVPMDAAGGSNEDDLTIKLQVCCCCGCDKRPVST